KKRQKKRPNNPLPKKIPHPSLSEKLPHKASSLRRSRQIMSFPAVQVDRGDTKTSRLNGLGSLAPGKSFGCSPTYCCKRGLRLE
ncbi:hypothetical protein KAV79_00215, partial [Candidatus Aerophobetes bacterium]|nr:hypothetical protein [Candidatus Aerophobetes bacterium]